MSLINFIQKIQQKPRYVRLQILWLAVFICMFFIVSLWIVSLKYSLPDATAKKTEGPLEGLKRETLSLKETFKASIGAFFEKDLEKEFENLENQEKSTNQLPKESREIKPAKLPLAE